MSFKYYFNFVNKTKTKVMVYAKFSQVGLLLVRL